MMLPRMKPSNAVHLAAFNGREEGTEEEVGLSRQMIFFSFYFARILDRLAIIVPLC